MKLDGGGIFEDGFGELVGVLLKHGKLDANYYFRKESGQRTASFILFSLGLPSRVRVDTGNPVLCRVGTTSWVQCLVGGFQKLTKKGEGGVSGEGILSRKNRASFALGTWKDLESHFFGKFTRLNQDNE